SVVFPDELGLDMAGTAFWVLASGTTDIFEIAVTPAPADDDHELLLTLNQFAAGDRPVRAYFYREQDERPRLMVLNDPSGDIAIVDLDTGSTDLVQTSWAFNQLEVFDVTDEETGVTSQEAVLFKSGSPTLVFAELGNLSGRGIRALSPLVLDSQLGSLEVEADTLHAVVNHSDGQRLSVVDLRRRYDVPLPASATISSVTLGPTGEQVYATVNSRPVLATIDLESGNPSEFDLIDPASQLLMIPALDLMLLYHRVPDSVTLARISDPNVQTSYYDFLFNDLFGQAESRFGGER
ncbi:MAG: hypothetical protein KC561_18995, partial [Myxococcales bacterium]|nr:hypothetical protein [Myxococcales bacterium]